MWGANTALWKQLPEGYHVGALWDIRNTSSIQFMGIAGNRATGGLWFFSWPGKSHRTNETELLRFEAISPDTGPYAS